MARVPQMVRLREGSPVNVPPPPIVPCEGCGCRGNCQLGPHAVCGLSPETGPLCSRCARTTGIPEIDEAPSGPAELPFGVADVADLALPFCACGHVPAECDGSRAGCKKRQALERQMALPFE